MIATPHPKGTRPPIRFLSVCSGIEAASQALNPLGFKAVAFSEVDKFACAVLKHRHPDVPNWGDMTKFQEWPDADLDALFGGTPCQPFSVAGLREGLADPRGNLMLTFGAVAARYRPRWIGWENVPGVLSSNSGRDFASFLGLITGQQIEPPADGWSNAGIIPGIADAYGVAYRVLDAQFVRTRGKPRAVPQRRRRVFVIGYLGDWRRAAAVLFDRESLRRDPPPRREAGQRPAPTISARPSGGGGLGTDFDLDGGLIAAEVAPTLCANGNKTGGNRPPGSDGDTTTSLIALSSGQANAEAIDVTPALLNHHGRQDFERDTLLVQAVAPTLRGEGFDATDDGTGKGTPIIAVPHPLPVAGTMAANGDAPGKHGFGMGQQDWENGYAVPVAIQERAVSENLEAGPGGAGYSTEGVAYTLEARNKVQAVAFDSKGTQVQTDETGTAPTLRAMGHADSHQNGGGQLAVAYGVTTGVTPKVGTDVSPTLMLPSDTGGGQVTAVAFAQNQRDELRVMDAAGALAAEPGMKQQTFLALPWAVRRLIPRECERLQGMADDVTNVPWRGKGTSPDGPRYKAIGNSWALNCIEWIGERMLIVDAWD